MGVFQIPDRKHSAKINSVSRHRAQRPAIGSSKEPRVIAGDHTLTPAL